MNIIKTEPDFNTLFSTKIEPAGLNINKLFKGAFDDMKYYDFLSLL